MTEEAYEKERLAFLLANLRVTEKELQVLAERLQGDAKQMQALGFRRAHGHAAR